MEQYIVFRGVPHNIRDCKTITALDLWRSAEAQVVFNDLVGGEVKAMFYYDDGSVELVGGDYPNKPVSIKAFLGGTFTYTHHSDKYSPRLVSYDVDKDKYYCKA